MIDEVNVCDVALFEDHVVVYPKNVRDMLKRFLNGQLSAEDINKWAEFICLRGEYSNPSWENEDDELQDYYLDMWDVIQSLSTPEIDGDISTPLVKQYLAKLEKYKADNH